MYFTFIDSLKALQTDYSQMYKKDLCTSRQVGNKPLRTIFILTSDKDVKSLPFINYIEELYGYKTKTITINPPIHCLQPWGREILKSSTWRLIRTLLPFIVNFNFLFISIYNTGAGKYMHLAIGQGPGTQEELWRYSRQDREEPTYRSAMHHVFLDIDSKNWHRFVS
ncbi:hypothetical protein BJX99DRAFT_241173 [Aspergillus californicus]